jgi:hypothetical protein
MHVVDPHDSRPFACVYAAVKPNGRTIIFTETPYSKEFPYWEMKRFEDTFEDEIKNWLEIERNWGISRPYMRIMDKMFGWQTRRQGTIASDMYKLSSAMGHPMTFMKSYTSNSSEMGEMAFGHEQVRAMLSDMDDGEPGLIIHNTCWHTWNGMKHYVRKRAKNQYEMQKAQGDTKPIEKYKDFPDVVRYLCSAVRLYLKPVNAGKYGNTEHKSGGMDKKSLDKIYHQNKSVASVMLSKLHRGGK